MKYNIIYADPPWQFKTYSKRGSLKKSADCHYSCMDLEDIKALQVSDIAAEDCILFLWVTFPLLREGLEVMRAWGIEKQIAGLWDLDTGLGPIQNSVCLEQRGTRQGCPVPFHRYVTQE